MGRAMNVGPYRAVLGRPGVPSLLTLSLLARIPIVSAPILLALHVVLDLDRGFAQSGIIAALIAIGGGIGSPLLGRAIDRVGLRPVVAGCTAAQTAFWLVAASLPFPALAVAAPLSGLAAIPIFSVARAGLAALLPPRERQAGFAVDAMLVEISFAVGPALFIVLLTALGSAITLPLVAMLIGLSGAAIWLVNPPMHDDHDDDDDRDDRDDGGARAAAAPTSLRESWTAAMTAILLISGASTVILAGTDVALTATMRAFDDVPLIGVVFATWCIASLVGGFVYGMRRPRSPSLLLALMAGLCLPAALATNWWALALLLIPTGLFCAPVMSTTSQALSLLAPATARGQAMGLQGSALIFGNAIGAPLTGLVVDHGDPRLGFVAIGAIGIGVTLALLPITRRIPIGAGSAAGAAPSENPTTPTPAAGDTRARRPDLSSAPPA